MRRCGLYPTDSLQDPAAASCGNEPSGPTTGQ